MNYNKILSLWGKLRQLILRHDTHPNDVNANDEHPNKIKNIDTNKKIDVSNNYTLHNDFNNSNTNYNNYNNNSSENGKVNNIDKEKNNDNVELCYNWKHHQSAHLIQKCGESLTYAIQFIQQSNTYIWQKKSNTLTSEQNNIIPKLNINFVINAINI